MIHIDVPNNIIDFEGLASDLLADLTTVSVMLYRWHLNEYDEDRAIGFFEKFFAVLLRSDSPVPAEIRNGMIEALNRALSEALEGSGTS